MTTTFGKTAGKFPLGQVVSTPGALGLAELGVNLAALLQRHANGDWGDVSNEDKGYNNDALKHGERLLSSYKTEMGKVWIITEWDRSVTTFLLPEEY